MSRLPHLRRDDSGFTLPELMIVCALLGFVVSGAYAFSYAVNAGSAASATHGVAARETGKPLELAEKYLMQTLAIEEAGPYRVQYRLDRDLSTAGTGLRQVIQVNADGEMTLTTTEIDESLVPIGPSETSKLVTHSANVTRGEPLFKYYDASGTQVTEMGYAPSKTYAMQIELVIEQGGAVYRDGRFVALRNRE